MRSATIKRKTKETDIEVAVNLDGSGVANVATGIGFFDHMLDLLARHSRIDITAKAAGDLRTRQPPPTTQKQRRAEADRDENERSPCDLHPVGIRGAVRGGRRGDVNAVTEAEEAEFLAFQKLFKHHLQGSFTE